MTILTTRWMEQEWLKTVPKETDSFFKAARYMDDIIIGLSSSDQWDKDKFLSDFKANCYWDPLKLEAPPHQDAFLETSFHISNGIVETRLKNDNEFGTNIWRYHHFESQMSYTIKRATVMATLRKVDLHASSPSQLFISARSKISEFLRKGYPAGILRYMCSILAKETKKSMWYRIRTYISNHKSL